jgi:hypothetical protein
MRSLALSMTIYRIPSNRYMAVVDEIPVIAIGTTYDNVIKIAQKKITNYFELNPKELFQSANSKGYLDWYNRAN